MLGGGSRFKTYAKASFALDTGGQVREVTFSTHSNVPTEDDADILALISQWREESEAVLSVRLGFNGQGLEQRNPNLRQAIIDSWLLQDPTADIAITNAGGLREGLPVGEITFGEVFNIMPFDNTIIAVEVPGRLVREVLAAGTRPVIAGLTEEPEGLMLAKTGELLEQDAIYRVLINSFMYQGGDNYGPLAEYDPNGFDTGMSYRQPFVMWLESIETSAANPLRL
jgi:2',3'-cyclic-nucleotide 2'-phosphodiesterase/3'-nucleotidase